MPLGVSKDCFPTPTQCHNCLRKVTSQVKKQSEPKTDLKRCSKCHMLTYCDRDCQTEHWLKVHKHHCRFQRYQVYSSQEDVLLTANLYYLYYCQPFFLKCTPRIKVNSGNSGFLSGKTLVDNSKHDVSTCARCIEERKTSPAQIRSENSPKTACNIENVLFAMKRELGIAFGFHGEGRKCNCSLEFACELPFSLGEVSGRYLEIGSTGLDVMMGHALTILTAMAIKGEKEIHTNALNQLWTDINRKRSRLWYDVLVGSRPFFPDIRKDQSEMVESLQTIYETSNPWWKALFNDSNSFNDPRFQNLKLIVDYQQSQIRNQAIVSGKQMWAYFMLWPGLVENSLAMHIPPGTRCDNCFAELCGELEMSPQGFFNKKSHPFLTVNVGDNGSLRAFCPQGNNNSNCWVVCFFKDVVLRVRKDEDQWMECLKERKLFGIESRDCDFCLKSSLSSHRCSVCRTVQYCSTVCQKKDLEFHKSVCSVWAKDKSRRIFGKEKQKDYWKSFFDEN